MYKSFLEVVKKNPIKMIAYILVIVGALNWLSIGLQNVNYVSQYFGKNANYIYITVGLAGVYLAYYFLRWIFFPSSIEHLTTDEIL